MRIKHWLGIVTLMLAAAGCTGAQGSGPPSGQTLVRTCAYALSCDNTNAFNFGLSASECVTFTQTVFAYGTYLSSYYNYRFNCVLNNNSCDAIRLCDSRNHGPSYCATHDGESCDGTVRLNCRNGSSYAEALDCADFGMMCTAANGGAECTTGVACDPATGDRCENNRTITCDRDIRMESALDCSDVLQGSMCGVNNNRASCLQTTTLCQSSEPRCDANVLVTCEDGYERRLDCASIFEGQCLIVGGTRQCVSTATECDGQSDRCNGTNLEVCLNGRYTSVPCSQLGFTNCGTVNGSTQCTN